MPTANRLWAFLRKSKNPYAYYNVFGDPGEFPQLLATETVLPAVPRPQNRGLSQTAFRDGCRRILLQYVPPAEGRVLRPHYRDFIIRNELRSPEQRFRLWEELSKYDIAASGNLRPHFNLDAELFTTDKLQEIEKVALGASPST